MRREPPVDSADERSDDETPADRVESGWVAWRVHRSIAELPDNERIVIELAYWGGRSQSEIADLLQVPLGTVKTRTRTGLARRRPAGGRSMRRRLRCRIQDVRALPARPSEMTSRHAARRSFGCE